MTGRGRSGTGVESDRPAGARAPAWKRYGRWALRIFAAVLVLGTLASASDANQWWIRIWDFPRIQILVVLVLAAIGLWFLDRAVRPWASLVLAVVAAYQLTRILPYTPLAPVEMADTQGLALAEDACFSLLTLNVLQDNRDYGRTLDLIRREDPDLLLLTETDQAWIDALEPVLGRYPGRIERPLDNTYGIAFASRLPMSNASIQDFAQADTPSVLATLEAGGNAFRMIGLHPRPPKPRQDTEERDAEIVMAARMADDLAMPVLALGDFNDVAWSDTTRLFRDIGGFLDPRAGRGTYATFPAGLVWLGWPLDHLFATREFLFEEKAVLGSVGSDHRPVSARLCLAPAEGRRRNALSENPDLEDEEEADEVMREFEEDTRTDAVEGEEG